MPLALAGAAAAEPLRAHADPVADYDIQVRLDAEAKTLAGRERILWRNPSADRVGDLWLHLYLNAFRNSESTFFRESGGQLRRDHMPEDGWGWTDITSLRRADGADLTKAIRFEHPDDGNALDRTVVRVPLPEPVPPGGEIALDVTWTARLPRVFARTGYVRDYFLAGQWFPKLGVYEPAGMRGRARGGWNCHQFHANSEFYADFGRYRVAITLPSRFVVGATGRRVERRANADGTVTHVYEQGDVTDFAWTASPHFLEVRRTFSGSGDVTPAEYAEAARQLGLRPEALRLGDVEILLLLQPGHASQLERHVAAAKAAIKWFGLWYGRYPHPTLTIVDPAPGGEGSGGMEYPTFFTAGSSFLFSHWPFEGMREIEGVIVHEFGHQYWQGMVATNEFEEPWLDEGVDSYSTGKVLERAYGPWMLQIGSLRVSELEMNRIANGRERRFDPIRTNAWDFSPGNYFTVYSRTELTLRTLEGLMGEDAVTRALRAYYERWRFAHPSSDDFFATPGFDRRRVFFEQTIDKPGVVDYEVAEVGSEPVRAPAGLVETPRGAVNVTAAEARRKDDESRRQGRVQWRSSVLVRRRGEVVLPVDLELRYETGETERIPLRDAGGDAWSGRWRRVEVVGSRRLASAVLDPEGRLVLDVSRLDDARRVVPDGRAASRWAASWAVWLEEMLAMAGL